MPLFEIFALRTFSIKPKSLLRKEFNVVSLRAYHKQTLNKMFVL